MTGREAAGAGVAADSGNAAGNGFALGGVTGAGKVTCAAGSGSVAADEECFDVRGLPGVVVLSGHYGVGKTNLALNLALDASAAGMRVVLADLDVVNPYFRSSDYANLLAAAGVGLIAPAFAGTTLDSPGITGKVVTAIAWAQEDAPGEGVAAGVSPAGDVAIADGSATQTAARRLLIIDAGGDDVGATVLGRFSRAIAQGPYAMLHVVNRSRNLTATSAEALAVLREVEQSSHLKVTAIVNNTHLADQTTIEVLERGMVFARKVAEAAGVPLAFCAVESSLESLADGVGVVYPVRILVRKPWE